MTHGELVSMAAQKLKKMRCLPICTEMTALTATGEIPDAIGWRAWESIMFECKASRADFLKDRDKPFRVCPESGVGDWRFYLTNPGVIHSSDELPDGWGCYEVIEGKIIHKFGKRFTNASPIPLHGNKKEEIIIMRSWIRRNYVHFCLNASAHDLLDALEHAAHSLCVTHCASCLPQGSETGMAIFFREGCPRGCSSFDCDMAKWWEIIRKVVGII